MRRTQRKMLAWIVVLASAGIACGGATDEDAGAPPAANAVSIQGFLFKPDALTVAAGTTVTWRNADDIAHTVTAGMPGTPSGAFDSGNKVKDELFTHTFPAAGSFPYFCNNHNGMRGSVTVT